MRPVDRANHHVHECGQTNEIAPLDSVDVESYNTDTCVSRVKTGIPLMDNISMDDKRVVVKGLLLGCPMGEALDDCPGRDLRKFSIEKRMVFVETMAPEQVEDIVVRHRRCIENRIAELPSL